MRPKEELIREIENRNKARAEAGLPLVSVSKEVEKISKAELRIWRDFCDWYKAPHCGLRLPRKSYRRTARTCVTRPGFRVVC